MNKKKTISVSIFVLVELVLYSLVVFIKPQNVTNELSFISILMCCIFSFFAFSVKEKTYLTHLALIFTVVADVFLVLIHPQVQTCAMISFSIVQLFYFIRILFESQSKKIRLLHIIARIIFSLTMLAVTVIVLRVDADFLSMISVFYYTNLILNVIFAFVNKNSSILFKMGLVLFLCCDTFVGLQAMSTYIALSPDSLLYKIVYYPFDFVWLFYLPAQVLLCLSVFGYRKSNNIN